MPLQLSKSFTTSSSLSKLVQWFKSYRYFDLWCFKCFRWCTPLVGPLDPSLLLVITLLAENFLLSLLYVVPTDELIQNSIQYQCLESSWNDRKLSGIKNCNWDVILNIPKTQHLLNLCTSQFYCRINCYDYVTSQTPFGGFKQSGQGREL